VVGAGSAGAALAARCAERGRRVLLVEAGPDYRSADMPEVWRSPNPLRAILDPEASAELVWPDLLATRTDSQEPHLYWRGRGVGGSSAINGQIAIRPPRQDFDDWAAAGCAGWSWAEILPYFCRIETDLEFGHEPYHGDNGPIPIYRTPRSQWGSVDEALARSALAHGFPWAADLNAPDATGVSPYPINSRDSRRVSTNDAYLEPARALEALSILGSRLVDRVLVRNSRAVGVELLQDGQRRSEYGDEIVVCAGAIHSPGILIRSGIGPASLLRELGVSVVADLPVGEGLQDHALLALALPLRPEAGIKTPDDRHTNVCVRYDSGDPDGLLNDMMLVSLNQSVLAMETADTAPAAGAIGAWINHPYSRGTVRLTSCDPHVQPVVHERMLSDERDLRRMRHAARLLAELAESEPVAEICAVSPRQVNPGLWEALEGDERELDAYLLASITDAQHGTCSCRMGPADNPSTVVDPLCRVLGVEGLRVADASIFPFCPRANTNLATIVVGEVVADKLANPG
jgi:choline dehydrogenase